MDAIKPLKNDVAPASASAYLDPNYWFALFSWRWLIPLILTFFWFFHYVIVLGREKRFSEEDHYEWFKDYSHFGHLILQHVNSNSSVSMLSSLLLNVFLLFFCIKAIIRFDKQVLEIGCGNSQLSEELYKDGITGLTCIDLSSVAVQKMKHRLSSKGYKGC